MNPRVGGAPRYNLGCQGVPCCFGGGGKNARSSEDEDSDDLHNDR